MTNKQGGAARRSLWRELRLAIGMPKEKDRVPSVLPLRQSQVASAKVFADRYTYIASLPHGGVGAEVGVKEGNFSSFILENARPTRLHLICQSITRYKVRERYADNPRVECHEGDSATLLATFPDAYFDWIYLDAGHAYRNVSADLRAATPKLKPNGLLVFNDYVLYSYKEGHFYGVVSAVNELCNVGWTVEAFCFSPNMHCDIAVRRPD